MNNRMIIGFALLGMTIASLGAQDAGEDAARRIARVTALLESQNANSREVTNTLVIETTEKSGISQRSSFTIYARWDPLKEERNSIAFQTGPSREYGKVYLNMGMKYWIYFPRTKRSSPLSAAQAVLGDASTGDFLSPPLLKWYNLEGKLSDDGALVVITLTAKDGAAPYGKVVQYYDGLRLIRAEQYARSGTKLKEAEYSDHATGVDGHPYPLKTRITNALAANRTTTIVQSSQREASVNQAWFNPLNLSQVK